MIPQLQFVRKGNFGIIEPRILPEHYCRFDDMAPVNPNDDIAFLQTTNVNNSAPGVFGSFYLGNGLPALGFRTAIHPFFKNMRVNVRVSGNWKPDILDSVASCVGAVVRPEGVLPTTYNFEPNVELIRTRALATFEYFGPRLSNESGVLIDNVKVSLLKNSTTEFMRRWIDAAGKRDRVALTNEPWAADIRKYRDLRIVEKLKAQGNKALKYTMDDYKAMTIYVELADYLNFGVILIGSDGVENWI